MENILKLLDPHIDLNNDGKDYVMFYGFIIDTSRQEFFAQWWMTWYPRKNGFDIYTGNVKISTEM